MQDLAVLLKYLPVLRSSWPWLMIAILGRYVLGALNLRARLHSLDIYLLFEFTVRIMSSVPDPNGKLGRYSSRGDQGISCPQLEGVEIELYAAGTL